MQKIFFIIISTSMLFASYNPFFSGAKEIQTTKTISKQQTKTIVYKKQKRENLKIIYFGFVESKKGRFALINFQGKNIVIKTKDSLYTDENIYKIIKITSNLIVLKDRYARYQSVYFSSQTNQSSN